MPSIPGKTFFVSTDRADNAAEVAANHTPISADRAIEIP
jgi:hypothetical protein